FLVYCSITVSRRPAVVVCDDVRANYITRFFLLVSQTPPISTLFPYTTLFRSHEVPEIRLHRSQIRLLLRVGELRNRDGGQNTDDHHNDQKLNEGETLAVHPTTSPMSNSSAQGND